MKNSIEVCFSPLLFPLFDSKECIVVVIDVLRATSSICVAFHHGVQRIVPVEKIEDCLAYRSQGFLVAAERKAEMVAGFDMGNSPFSFMVEKIEGSSIAMTTTNGTRAIHAAKVAHRVVIGSFLNLDVLCSWLATQNKNVICLCAGWKDKFNLEDSLFAGALAYYLKKTGSFFSDCDSTLASEYIYSIAQNDLAGFLQNSSHRKRLEKLQIEKDVEYCLTPNQAPVIPVLAGEFLLKLQY